MKSFRDNAGRTWIISIHVTAIKRVRGLLNVDLYGLVDDGFKGLGQLLSDPIALVDVLYVLCKDEADKLGISDEDFGRAMGGDSIEAGALAFVAEFTDFFQNPRVRAGITKLIDASKRVQTRLMDRMMIQLDAIDPEAEAAKLLVSSGNLPESSGSTPDPLRSANST